METSMATTKTYEPNDWYIVRTMNAGVFFGHIKERTGDEAVLTDARRLWYWEGATECIGLATSGVKRPENCKFTVRIPEITVLGVVEFEKCSAKAAASLNGVKEWTA